MFWKKDSSGDSNLGLQDIPQTPASAPAVLQTSSLRNQHKAMPSMAEIDHHEGDEKASGGRLEVPVEIPRSRNPCKTAQRRFFSSNSFSLSRARNVLVTGKAEGPRFRPQAEMAAHIPEKTSAFKLIASFNNFSAGHYTIQWRVKVLQDFAIPNGFHFVVHVSYDAEPDISGSLDVIMPGYRLNVLAKDRWYNLILEEKLVIEPHVGNARIQVVLCNNENIDRVEYFGFVIEHVEIRPMTVKSEPQAGVSDFMVSRAAIPNYTIDMANLRPSDQNGSYMPPNAPVTRLASSKSSRFLASLALSQDAAYITVWDMGIIKNPLNPSRNMSKLYRGCAVAVVPHTDIGELPIGLALSTNGDQVAIYQEPKIGEWMDGSKMNKASFPFKLFDNPLVPQASVFVNIDAESNINTDVKNEAPAEDEAKGDRKQSYNSASPAPTPSEMRQLKEVQWEHSILRTFIGYGEFLPETRKSDWEKNDVNAALTSSGDADEGDGGDESKETSNRNNSSPSSTMFVACNGLYLDVFKISPEKRWKRMHTITLTELLPTLSRRITCKMMMESISSNTFMWLEDGGRSCTIWNLLTGSNITHISSIENARFKGPTFHGHSKMAISPHESIVALASVDGSLTTYFANTGMAIDDRKFPGFKIEYIGFHGQDDQLFVILRSSVNYELSAWILDSLQLKSETAANQVPIPTIDSTILALFYVKRFWKRGIICESDGTKINCYISHQPTSSKLIKDSETALKAAPEDVVYESSHDVDIQYRLLTGIHRELLPEGDGKSYWVLRVEVVEENLKQKTSRIIFSFVPEPWMRVTTEEVVHPENLQSTFFVPCGTRFAVVGMQTLQIWNLPTTENSKCSLQFIWSQPRDEKELLPGGVAYKSRRVRDYYMDIMGISIFLDAETGSTVAEIKMNDRSRKKIVPIPGPGNIGARYAILYCFRSVHLLSAAYTFSHNESKKTTRDSPQLTFTFEDHAEAIVRFTREHINRMMSICVFSPRRPGQAQNNTKDAKGTKRPGPSTVNQPAPLNNIQPISDADVLESSASAPGAVVVGENVTVHANANRHDDDEVDLRPQNIRGKHDYKRRTPQSKSSTRSDVVTVLTLLLDHPHLQRTNHVFVEGLLNSSNGDWIPRDNKALNPIKRVIEARNGQLLEAFVDYCIKNAKKYHPAYLMPAVQCLNELSDRYPNVLADLFRKASYVPVHNYGYVASHAIIANEQYGKWLKSKLMFWNIFTGKKFEKSNNINDYEKPVFSLRSQLPFRASSLLNILHIETSVREKREEEFPARPDVVEEDKKSLQSEFSHKIYVSPFPKLSMYGPYRPWFKDMASAKSAFTDIAGQDFFDSPAMVATLEFKWQKFGLFYWIWRFSVVFTFFVLVLIITAKQIYTSSNLDDVSPADIASRYLLEWRPLFKAVIIFGFILIVYEIMQFLDSPRKYIRSPYNYMDLAAYVLPVVGCLMFLQTQPGPIDISTDIVDGDRGPSQIWVMSFAILALYMNILFELRVIKQLGIVVNIILNITRRIGWFFLIFGLFLIAFTHALLHLLHTRRYDPCVANDTCEGEGRDYPDGYPTGFFSALSATYFFLAGRYDPISDSFDKGSTSFHVMMVIFFFFTAILLLNILIALMNDAYNESKDQGQLAWLKQWSEVIAEVEIFLMSQGARQNRNYFPDYVYYGANEQEAELYESKYYIANKSNLSIENRFLVDTVTGEQVVAQVTQRAIHKDVQLLKQELERMKNAQDGFNQDMTELMAAFLAQTTTVAPTSPDCDQPPQVSPVENDPPNSGASPTTGSGISVPGGPLSAPGTGLPGGVVRSSAGAAAAAAAVFSTAGQSNRRSKKQSSVPFRRKISTTILETESPTSYSPTVHFNSPQSSISTSPISAGDAASHLPGEGTIDAGPASVGASPSSVPQRIAEHPHLAGPVRRKSSYSSIKRRLQQKLAVVRTMDDVLKTHQMIEDNNASHPIYIKPPGRRDSEDDELYDTEEDEEDLMKTVTVHHAQRPSPDQPEHLRRAHSEILLRSIPHNPIPLHTLPVHPSPGEDSTVQNE